MRVFWIMLAVVGATFALLIVIFAVWLWVVSPGKVAFYITPDCDPKLGIESESKSNHKSIDNLQLIENHQSISNCNGTESFNGSESCHESKSLHGSNSINESNSTNESDTLHESESHKLAQKCFVEIGGVKQGMIIRSTDTISKPVLLYVHGGPAFPNYFLVDKHNPGLEELFTVCYWEQRGGGLSYSDDMDPGSVTIDRLTDDTIEVSEYLRKRFKVDQIYIMAHSGGSILALQAVANAPHLYKAYFAIAQVTNQAESERIAWRYMIHNSQGKKSQLAELKAFDLENLDNSPLSFFVSPLRDAVMHSMGIGTMHKMRSLLTGIFLPSLNCRAYTLREKLNMWRSKIFFIRKTPLAQEIIATDFSQKITTVNVPIYFFCGKHDMTVNVDLVQKYFQQIKAPSKKIFLFQHSAHSPQFEEPQHFVSICKELI